MIRSSVVSGAIPPNLWRRTLSAYLCTDELRRRYYYETTFHAEVHNATSFVSSLLYLGGVR